MAFAVSRVQESLFPQIWGGLTTVGAEIGAAMIDDKIEWARPYAQYGASVLTVGGGAYLLGTGRYVDFSKGMVLVGMGMMALNVGRAFAEKALRKPVQSRMVDFASLMPQQKVNVSAVLSEPTARRKAEAILGVGQQAQSMSITGGETTKVEQPSNNEQKQGVLY